MPMHTFSYPSNEVLILESLGPTDSHTGRRLYEDLATALHPLAVNFVDVPGRADLERELGGLAMRARATGNVRPILHIEIHGADDRSGLMLASGETLPWDDFSAACRRIVSATDNNLLVVMAVCYGFRAILGARISDKKSTPFTFLIGSETTLTNEEIEASFAPFYERLFATNNIDEARRATLSSKFGSFNCEETMARAFGDYVRSQGCRGKKRDRRVERLLTTVLATKPGLNIAATRADIRSRLKDLNWQFEKFRDSYLLAKRPANDGRFRVTLADVLANLD